MLRPHQPSLRGHPAWFGVLINGPGIHTARNERHDDSPFCLGRRCGVLLATAVGTPRGRAQISSSRIVDQNQPCGRRLDKPSLLEHRKNSSMSRTFRFWALQMGSQGQWILHFAVDRQTGTDAAADIDLVLVTCGLLGWPALTRCEGAAASVADALSCRWSALFA